jgi:glycosyltransferase involved in cell wall biosynthesis
MTVRQASPAILVNARSMRTRHPTGVQRWAAEVVRVLEASATVETVAPRRAHGRYTGHVWEQTVLPVLAGRRSPVLLSPCNWGPVAVRRQVLVLHDIAPILVPQFFSPQYVRLARSTLQPLAKRVARIATVSQSAKADIVRHLGVPEDKVAVVGCGVRPTPLPAVADPEPAPYFLFVGAHDARKNLRFLLDLWPAVWRSEGAALVVTRRAATSVHAAVQRDGSEVPWLRVVEEPSDERLAVLYAQCQAVLQPSHHEGFGLPLLEAMAYGRPFVSTPVGAAPELAAPGCHVLPLDAARWTEAVRSLAGEEPGPAGVLVAASAGYSWQNAADAIHDQLRAAAQ